MAGGIQGWSTSVAPGPRAGGVFVRSFVIRRPALLALPFLVGAAVTVAVPSSALAAGWFTAPPSDAAWRAAPWRDAAGLLSSASTVLRERAEPLGLSAAELQPGETFQLGPLGTVRFHQRHHGLPVRGAGVVLRLDDAGVVRAAVVDVARMTASAIPTLGADEARARVGQLLGVDASGAPAELGFERHEARGGLLAWYVDVESGGAPRRWVIDARQGTLLGQLALTVDANGRVFPKNPVRTPKTVEAPLPELLASTPQYLVGAGGAVRVHNYVSGTFGSSRMPMKVEQKTVPNMGADFLYDPLASNDTLVDPFAEVNLYYHLMRVRSFFQDRLGVKMSGPAWSLLAVANYGPDQGYFDNAFFTAWSPSLGGYPGNPRNFIIVGNGRTGNFSYDSDIVLHEFVHFVNRNAIDFNHGGFDFDEYGSVIMPAAIDEGTADYFSCSMNDDPEVGESSLGPGVRNLTDEGPRCPDGLVGESHADGQTIANLVWVIRASLGAELTDRLLWSSMTMMPDRPSFGDVGKGLLQAAADLKLDPAQVKVISDGLARLGVDECGRFLPIGPRTKAVRLPGLQGLAWQFGTNCTGLIDQFGFVLTSPFQFTWKPAPTDRAAVFRVGVKANANRRLSWGLYARAGSPVLFAAQGGGADTFDYSAPELTTNGATLIIDENSTPPFDPNTTYHVAIGHQNCSDTVASITATNTVPLPDMATSPDLSRAAADAGAAAPMLNESGCSCAIGGSAAAPSGAAWALLLVAGMAAVRRWRRRA